MKIAVIGGGTGTSVVLNGLKQYPCQLSAIVVVTDSGGSTGRLRDEFGFLPVGDLRQCLAALSKGELQEDIRNLLLYRFDKGTGLKGHNLGNLILTALEDISPSPAQAIEKAAKIFSIQGNVFPITEKIVDLCIEYQDGTVKIGEHLLDDIENGGKKITKIKLSPHAKIYHKAQESLKKSDVIILGPGDLYASLLPNARAKGFKKTLKKNKGKFIYVVNLMTHYSQTHNMSAQDHVDEVTEYCGRRPDVVIMHQGKIDSKILKNYEQNNEFPVKDDLKDDQGYRIIRENLISENKYIKAKSDKVPRSILRHDSDKLSKIIIKAIKS